MNWLDLINSDEFDGLIRHSISVASGGMVANGLMTQDQVTQIAGAVGIVVSVIWSVANKRYMRKKA